MINKLRGSLFLKNFIIYIMILLFSFLALGIVFTFAFKKYYLNQKQELLIGQAERISEQYALGIYTGIVDAGRLRMELSVLANNMGASTILVDGRGRILFVSSDLNSEWVGQYVDISSDKETLGDEVSISESPMGNIFSDTALTVTYPIKADDRTIGLLVMAVSVPGVREQLFDVYSAIFGALTICGIIAFGALYFSVKRITKPLIEINDAAKVIAGGDFEKRIETDLTDEVGQLARSFNEMARGLSEIEENKRLFITNISHDIRSPLTSVLGFVTAMLDGTVAQENFPKYLNIVKDESNRIIKLTNEMIDLNSLDDGTVKLDIKPFDINTLIRKCAARAESEVRMKNIEFDLIFFEEKTIVLGDAGKIERVLENLLDNAIKFTESGGISVETGMNEQTHKKVIVSVRDTGIGISEDQQKNVFERFYKADDSRGEIRSGNGLGLSIVREFIKAHDETITLESVKDKGSCFSFTLQPVKTD